MTSVALQSTSGQAWHRLANACRAVLSAMAEGFGAARRYQRLAIMNDAQLGRLGLTRADLPWFALYGERRPG